jgi:BON domain-containing protein
MVARPRAELAEKGDPAVMMTTSRRFTVIGLVLVLLAGCTTMTGRSMGRYMDDKVTNTKVKARLAALKATSLTRISVDTYNGTVYLNGVVGDQAEKQRMDKAAAEGGHRVVSNLQIANAGPGSPSGNRAASRRDGSQPSHSTRVEAAGSASPTSSAPMARHSAVGQVITIDHDTGKMTLRTDDGMLDVRVPPESVKDVESGDQLTVDIGLRPAAR